MTTQHTFELIVFDWDGTLMDSAARIVASLRAAGAEMGLAELDEATLKNVIGLGMREAVLALHPALNEAEIARFIDRYRHHFLVACPTPTVLFEGVHELFDTLSKTDIRLAVATGKSRKGLDRVLEETQCGRYFHTSRTADETCSKPDPRMLLEIIEELDVAPDKTLMVGDTEYDLAMAQRVGAASLAVSYGVHESHRLQRYSPLACLESVADLHQWMSEYVIAPQSDLYPNT